MPPAPPEAQKKPLPPPKDAKAAPEAGGKAPPDKPGAKAAAGKDQQQGKPGAQPGAARSDAAKRAGKEAQESGQRLDRMAVRAKMAVSAPGDAVEREADGVADKVMRSMAGAGRGVAPRPDPPAIARDTDDKAKDPVRPTVPADFAKDLGAGMPLDAATRGLFEQQFGRDFSRVRVHDDARSDAAARRIGARAFAIGDNIAFAGSEYEPETPEGRRLLAHELTHVVQQSGGVTRMVMRNPAGGGTVPVGGGAATPGATDFTVKGPLQVPPIKSRHASTYAAKAATSTLRRPRAYNAATRGTNQVGVWMKDAKVELSHIPKAHKPAAGQPWSLPLQQQGGSALVGGAPLTGTDDQIKDKLKRPAWDADGNPKEFQVDHMVEFQLGGQDVMPNFELLDQASNGSVGSSFSHEINKTIRQEIATSPAALPAVPGVTMPAAPDADFVKTNYDVVFKQVPVRGRESGRKEGNSLLWSAEQIEAAEPATKLLPGAQGSLAGTAQKLALLSPTGAMVITHLPVSGGGVSVAKGSAGGIAGFKITAVSLTASIGDIGGTALAAGSPVGQVEGELDLGPAVKFPAGQKHALALQKATDVYAVKIASTPMPGPNGTTNLIPATFTPLSPMEITGLTVGRGVYAGAIIQPEHPALSGLRIPGQIRDGKVGIFHTLDVTSLAERMKIPGLTVDGASVTIGYNGVDVSVGGSLAFTIRNFGQGVLTAELDSKRKFSLEGSFTPDPRLFDEGSLKLWYRSDEGFGGAGRLAITPKKIKGIKSARVAAKYEKGVFHADGTVEPDLPGVKNAGLSVTYGPDASGADSLVVAGELQLGAGIPGLSSGSIKVTLVQKSDAWKVAASGTIKPDLPGMAPAINLNYDDGLFDGTVSASFDRGIFSGAVEVGLTNRAVTPEGTLSGTEPGPELRLYGKGDVTAKVTPWLSGKVGIKVKPTGSLLISGRIGIPDAVTVFEQFPAAPADRRRLLSLPTLSIPLFGAPGAGVALTVNGGVDAYAHVGPGKLTQAAISVLDFDPAHPDSLHITGKASFEIPATAGVDATLDAGLSAGFVLSLKAGLGVTAGISADAMVKPQVDVDWTPTTGLHLHAELQATLSPKLKFGVTGYVAVVAGAFGIEYELWRKDWELLKKEAGGNLAIGVTAPVDYYTDGRGIVFDPQKVTFQVPSLDVETLKNLLNNDGKTTEEHGEGDPPAL